MMVEGKRVDAAKKMKSEFNSINMYFLSIFNAGTLYVAGKQIHHAFTFQELKAFPA